MFTIYMIGLIVFILFVFFCVNIYTLSQLDKDQNKELLDSKSYSVSYYGSILFAMILAAVAIYYGYKYNTGNNIFKVGSSETSIDGVMKQLSTAGINQVEFATTPVST